MGGGHITANGGAVCGVDRNASTEPALWAEEGGPDQISGIQKPDIRRSEAEIGVVTLSGGYLPTSGV